ncbi:MAG: hypothetical protein KJ592_03040 [Nanoarchaeota archaeon]|nr:hypothetical protein [Nanoarchaeota archaeon]
MASLRKMKSEDLISILLMIIISIGILALGRLLNFDNDVITWVVLIAAFVIVIIVFIIISFSKVDNDILDINKKLRGLKKDLNISERLSKIEGYFEFEKMKKRGQVLMWKLLLVAAVIILGYVILDAIGIF